MIVPHMLDRRAVLKSALAAPVAIEAARATAQSRGKELFGPDRLLADVRAFANAGNKQSGGPGDRWSADWTAERLADAGFSVERQSFDVPFFISSRCELKIGSLQIPLVAQPLVVPTEGNGLTAPLRLADSPGRLDGAIALVRLPYRRWSSILDKLAHRAIADALGRGASAAILVTHGPTNEVLLLNAPAAEPLYSRPLALLAPKLAKPVVEAARYARTATLRLEGRGGSRQAENIIGRRSVSGGRWLVISTPRSGWTDCVGERGPGLAIWLALANWVPYAFPQHSLLLINSSGHEYENLGAGHLVADHGPPPAGTDFWLHLGANAATRDWHETPDRLLPLPSADPYRFLMVSPDLVGLARDIFAGQPGIEMAYPSSEGTAGELTEIVKAGYPRHAGIFGAHRQHHSASDDMSTIVPAPLATTARGFRDLLSSAISTPR